MRYADLLALNRRIDALSKQVTQLELVKKLAHETFQEAGASAVEAQRDLAALLKKLAYARFATDVAFDVYDIVAAMRKGGIVGAVSEGVNKIVQRAAFAYADSPSGIEPDSIEARINAEYRANLSDSLAPGPAGQVLAQRVLKDTAFKYVKNTALNGWIGSRIYQRFEVPLRQEFVVKALAGGAKDFGKAQAHYGRITKQLDSLKKGYSLDLGKAVEGIVKDGLKNLSKGGFDRLEAEAWKRSSSATGSSRGKAWCRCSVEGQCSDSRRWVGV